MASFIDDLKRLYTQIEGGPQAQGSLLYEEPSPFASMVRSQFSNQNYQGSQPLQERFTKEIEENRARTAPTSGLQRDIAVQYLTGTPGSLEQERQNLTKTIQTQKDMENLAASLAPATPFPTPAPLTMKPIPAGVNRTPAETVSDKVNSGIDAGAYNGTNMGNADRKAAAAQTMLGGDLQALIQNLLKQQNPTPPKGDFVSNLLRMFAQPEFQKAGFAGQGFGPTVLGATRALRAMETQDAEMLKAKMDAVASAEAAGPLWSDAKSFQVEKFDNLQKAIKSADTIQNMKKLLSEGFVTGGIPQAVDFLKGLGNLVNISLKASNLEEYKTQTNKLAADLVASGIFGKEVNKSEWDLIFELIAKPGATKGSPELQEKLNSLLVRINNIIESDSRVLKAMGVPIEPLLASRQSLVSERNVGGGN